MNHVPDYDYGTVLKKNLTSFKQQNKEKKAIASNQEANESNYDVSADRILGFEIFSIIYK